MNGDANPPLPARQLRLLDALPANIAILDAKGTIIGINRGWRRFAEANDYPDPSAALGANYLAVCDGAARQGDEVAATVAAGIRRVLSGQETEFRLTYPCHAPDQRRWFDMTVGKLEKCGPARVIVQHTDNTLLALAAIHQEELRVAKEEAEHANHSKSRFLAAASHDLRQPLMALGLLIDLLRRRSTDPQSHRIVEQARETLDGMIELFDALLDLSTMESGAHQVSPEPIAFSTLLKRLTDEFAPLARNKGIRLRAVPCDVTLTSDPILLERILRNLLTNAIRYTESGGVLIGCRRRGDRARIDVVDTGIGIASEHQKLIFEETYQVGNWARSRRHGHGLGLAIVKRAAGLLNADIEVRSVTGKGSVFSILVPIAEAPRRSEAGHGAVGGEKTPAESRIAIVIEDDPLVSMALSLFLEEHGITVMTAANGAEAFEILQDLPGTPNLLIADYNLPGGISGLEVVTRVQRTLATDIPAWIITGDASPEKRIYAEAQGIGFLRKPVRPEDIQSCILDSLDAT